MKTAVGLIHGDGIGPEICRSVVAVLEASGAEIEWNPLVAGEESLRISGEVLPEFTLDQARSLGVVLKGPMNTPIGKGHRSANVQLRSALDLYANIRPCLAMPGVRCLHPQTDLIIVRENTEGLYVADERYIGKGAEAIKRYTNKGCERITRKAFRLAESEGRKLTFLHKANILKITDGLFLKIVRNLASEYPNVPFEELIIDNGMMKMVMHPENFGVILVDNYNGDLISDMAAGFIGGLGLAPGANIGDNCAVFEAVHGTAPDIAGLGIANPTALLLSACMMLDYLGKKEIASRIRRALYQAFRAGDLTKDLGGSLDTQGFTKNLLAHLDIINTYEQAGVAM